MMDTRGKLWISRELVEKIRAHGAETYPNECCGALLGRDAGEDEEQSRPREILGLFPMVNRREDSPRNRFSVTPQDVMAAEKAAAGRGLDLIGWYHSHPDHPARPSEYDREHAWPWYSYIIVRVQTGVAQEMTSWRLEDDRERYMEESIEGKEEATK
ncbi:MAG: M67 family metallopeptidase [Candidatus Acidiferrum sp.]